MADVLQPEARDRVRLSISGKIYAGWTEVQISRAIDTICSSFVVSLADREPGADRAFAFEAGAPVTLQIGSETILTGFIDQLAPSYSNGSHAIRITGRDRAADLVDCSAVHKPASWKNVALETIASDLAKPFGITITAKASTAPRIKSFALQQGESVFEAIERLCRFRALLPISTPEGNVELVAITPGDSVETLAQGVNILAAEATHDVSGRFSQYIIKGQAAGDDQTNGRAITAIRGEATDPAVTRYRPLIVMAEDQDDRAGFARRARWEAVTRLGRSQLGSITTTGWRTPTGKLRAPGMCFDVDSAWLFMQGKMIATDVTLSYGPGGTISTIGVARPEAFSQLAVSETAKASRVKDRSQ